MGFMDSAAKILAIPLAIFVIGIVVIAIVRYLFFARRHKFGHTSLVVVGAGFLLACAISYEQERAAADRLHLLRASVSLYSLSLPTPAQPEVEKPKPSPSMPAPAPSPPETTPSPKVRPTRPEVKTNPPLSPPSAQIPAIPVSPTAAPGYLDKLLEDGSGAVCFVVTLFATIVAYIFSIQRGLKSSIPVLRRLLPDHLDVFYYRLDFLVVSLCGAVIGYLFFRPETTLQSLSAGMSWVGAINILGGHGPE